MVVVFVEMDSVLLLAVAVPGFVVMTTSTEPCSIPVDWRINVGGKIKFWIRFTRVKGSKMLRSKPPTQVVRWMQTKTKKSLLMNRTVLYFWQFFAICKANFWESVLTTFF